MLTISWCGIRIGTVRSCGLRVRLCRCLADITTLTLAARLHRDKLPLHVARIYLYIMHPVIAHEANTKQSRRLTSLASASNTLQH